MQRGEHFCKWGCLRTIVIGHPRQGGGAVDLPRALLSANRGVRQAIREGFQQEDELHAAVNMAFRIEQRFG